MGRTSIANVWGETDRWGVERPRRSGPRPARPDGGPAFCGLTFVRSTLEVRESTRKWKVGFHGSSVALERRTPIRPVPASGGGMPMRASASHAAGRDFRTERRSSAALVAALVGAPMNAQDFSLERVDPNEISMVVSNWGFLSYDLVTGGAGLEYPKGTGKTAMFASGLWLGATLQGQQRVALSEYTSEYMPGAFLFGSPESPFQAALRVYKLQKSYPDAGSRDAALNDYNAGAVPRGAPAVHVLADGTLDILGDQMLWAVYNDFDPARHTATPGHTAPLGVEVQQTAYAFDRPGALKKTVLLSLRI